MGKFQVGNPGGPGRIKGSKNKKTEAWEKLGAHITGEWADKIIAHGNKLIDEDRMDEFFMIYERLVNYFKPKQASTTIHAEIQVPQLQLNLRTDEAMEAMKGLLGQGDPNEGIQDAEIVPDDEEKTK